MMMTIMIMMMMIIMLMIMMMMMMIVMMMIMVKMMMLLMMMMSIKLTFLGKDVYRQKFEEVPKENSNVCFTNETCLTDISDVVESHSADSTKANDPQGVYLCNKNIQ
jgi:hypothetical protein